jgi:hypothetical protein
MTSAGPAVPPLEAAYRVPLYRKAEAARLIGVPRSTLRHWAGDGGPGLVTVIRPARRGGPSVPFLGLAEAFVLASLRRAGVPMQRIRVAVARLEAELGVTGVLASDRLLTAGGDVVWDYRPDGAEAGSAGPGAAETGLAEVRSGQLVLWPSAPGPLSRVTYAGGWARALRLGSGDTEVTVDPLVSDGRPVLTRHAAAAAGR